MSTAAPSVREHTTAPAHNCPVPSNRQNLLMCGGPGVGTCIAGTCQCEPQYAGLGCGDCGADYEPVPAPEWGPVATFCSTGTTPSISVSQIPVRTSTRDTSLQSAPNNNTTSMVLGVAGAMVLIMAVALLYVVRNRHTSLSLIHISEPTRPY